MFGIIVGSLLLLSVGGYVAIKRSDSTDDRGNKILTDFSILRQAYLDYQKINIVELQTIGELRDYMPKEHAHLLKQYDLSENGHFIVVKETLSQTTREHILTHADGNSFVSDKTGYMYLALYKFSGKAASLRFDIIYSPKTDITTQTSIDWSYQLHVGDTTEIVEEDWCNRQTMYEYPGEQVVKLRLKDTRHNWTDWQSVAIVVTAGDHYKRLTASVENLFALKENGSVYGLGKNRFGELGSGTLESIDKLTKIRPLSTIAALACGDNHTLFSMFDGSVYACGNNDYGQLGIGTRLHSKVTQKIWGLSMVRQVAACDNVSAAVDRAGHVYLWGDNGQRLIIDDATSFVETPYKVNAVSDVKRMALSSTHVLCLDDEGNVYAWGDNGRGQLGSVEKSKYLECFQVDVPRAFNLAASDANSFIVLSSGELMTMGSAQTGVLGYQADVDQIIPRQVEALSEIVRVASQFGIALALDAKGCVYTWGQYDNLIEDVIVTPRRIDGVDGCIDIAIMPKKGLALMADGTVITWDRQLQPEELKVDEYD